MISSSPCPDAMWRAVLFVVISAGSSFAPYSTRSFTMLMCPLLTANINGVNPSLVVSLLKSAPYSIRRRTTSKFSAVLSIA
jgi:hypothetical protein